MCLDIHDGNFAFIDGINLHLTFEHLDWKLDYRELRTYLRKRHDITTAYYFLGYMKEYNRIYEDLELYGYTLIFRDVSKHTIEPTICPQCEYIIEPERIKTKCDCDADLTLQAMNDIDDYQKAIIISSDGDFDNLVKNLLRNNKLKLVLAPCRAGCSRLLIKAAMGRIDFLDYHRTELEYHKNEL